MSFTTIDSSTIQVGDPITKNLLDLIKANFDDHELRINNAETTGGTVFVYNGILHLANFNSSTPDVFYFKAIKDFSIVDFRGQIFAKGAISSGTLSFDLQKATNTNNANFNTILNSALSFNFSTDADYLEKVASINSSVSSFVAGNVLRVVVTGIPAGFKDRILIYIGAE